MKIWSAIAHVLVLLSLLAVMVPPPVAGATSSYPPPTPPPPTGAPLGSEPPRPTYEQWLREAFIAAQRGDRLGLEEIAPRLIEARAVVLDDGTSVPVDNQWLQHALDTPDPDLQRIATRLGAVLDALAQPEPTAPDDARQRLQQILNRPPFQSPESRNPGLFSQLLDWLGRFLSWVFSPLGKIGSEPASIIGYLFLLLMLALVIGVIVYFLRSMRYSLAKEAHLASDADPDAHLSSAAAMKQAQELARGGDTRTAVRYLYLSSLLWLDEREWLQYNRALTNREYLARVQHPEVQTHLRPIVETFDRVWYGYMPLSEQDFAAYQQQVARLQKVRGAAPRPSDAAGEAGPGA